MFPDTVHTLRRLVARHRPAAALAAAGVTRADTLATLRRHDDCGALPEDVARQSAKRPAGVRFCGAQHC